MSANRIAEALSPDWMRSAAIRWRVAAPQGEVARWMKTSVGLVVFTLDTAALAALTLGLWRLGADLAWTDSFFIGQGLWSHWQVWLALAMALKMAHVGLGRTMERAAVEEKQSRP